VFTEDHEAFRSTIREFIAEEVVPHYARWERAGHVPRDLYRRLGDLGVFGIQVPEEFGGAGVTDFRFLAVLREECARAGVTFGAETVHICLVLPYLLEFGNAEQKRRFEARIDDPLRQWKLSPMDLPSRGKWFEYSRARDKMLDATDTKWAPWYILRSDDKKRARLNAIRHILSLIPYENVPREKIKLPKRSMKGAYDDQASLKGRKFVPEKY